MTTFGFSGSMMSFGVLWVLVGGSVIVLLASGNWFGFEEAFSEFVFIHIALIVNSCRSDAVKLAGCCFASVAL